MKKLNSNNRFSDSKTFRRLTDVQAKAFWKEVDQLPQNIFKSVKEVIAYLKKVTFRSFV